MDGCDVSGDNVGVLVGLGEGLWEGDDDVGAGLGPTVVGATEGVSDGDEVGALNGAADGTVAAVALESDDRFQITLVPPTMAPAKASPTTSEPRAMRIHLDVCPTAPALTIGASSSASGPF